MDAPGFEPGASPLQGERSTADLRAPWGVRGLALSYLNDSSQSLHRFNRSCADGHRCLLHSVNALPLDSVQQAKRKVCFV